MRFRSHQSLLGRDGVRSVQCRVFSSIWGPTRYQQALSSSDHEKMSPEIAKSPRGWEQYSLQLAGPVVGEGKKSGCHSIWKGSYESIPGRGGQIPVSREEADGFCGERQEERSGGNQRPEWEARD